MDKENKDIITKNIKKQILIFALLLFFIAIFAWLLILSNNLNENVSINKNLNLNTKTNSNSNFNFLIKSNTKEEIKINRIYCKKSNEIAQTNEDIKNTQNKEINSIKYLEVKGEGESEETNTKTNWEAYLKEEENSEEKKEKKEIKFKKANRKYIILLLVILIIFFTYIFKKFFEKDDILFKKIKTFLGLKSQDKNNFKNNEFQNSKMKSNKIKNRKTFEENIF